MPNTSCVTSSCWSTRTNRLIVPGAGCDVWQPRFSLSVLGSRYSRDAASIASGDSYPQAPWKLHDPLPLTLAYVRALDSSKAKAIRDGSTGKANAWFLLSNVG